MSGPYINQPMEAPIRHVIVLMLENHSFDQMLGAFKAKYPSMRGVDPVQLRENKDLNGKVYKQQPTTDFTGIDPDPPHDLAQTLTQISQNNGRFVSTYHAAYPSTSEARRQRIIDYYERGSLSALHTLAEHFLICDQWYASVPGPTWTNRFFAQSGTSLGIVSMPSGIFDLGKHWYDQETIYDRLNAAEPKLDWRVYYGDIPQSLLFVNQRNIKNATKYRRLSSFFSKCNGPENEFPHFAFIEPKYFLPQQNDDHPPHKPQNAQRLMADVYNAIRANAALWASTLLVIVYDEHGGFFDHMFPSKAQAPDEQTKEYTFDQYGVRVPAILVSPWVKAGVDPRPLDHTSILRFLIDSHKLSELTERVRKAQSMLSPDMMVSNPRTDTPLRIDIPDPFTSMTLMATDTMQPSELNENQKALLALTQELEKETEDAPETKLRRTELMLMSPVDQVEVGIERVDRFLVQRRRESGEPPER